MSVVPIKIIPENVGLLRQSMLDLKSVLTVQAEQLRQEAGVYSAMHEMPEEFAIDEDGQAASGGIFKKLEALYKAQEALADEIILGSRA